MIYKIDKIREAMGLASMNPMVGIGGNTAILANNTKDKDLKDSWSNYSLINGNNFNEKISVNNNGKLIKDKINFDEGYEFFKVKIDASDKLETIMEELKLPEEQRPKHNKKFLYEYFTGHKMYTNDQPEYDPLLEKVYLDKLSKQMSAGASNIGGETIKDSHYPLEEKPLTDIEQNNENVHFPLLSHTELLDKLETDVMTIRGDDYEYAIL